MNGRNYPAGSEIAWHHVYPFFLFHMLMFGGSGFFLAYGSGNPELLFLFAHGGFAIVVYTAFYLVFFGLDEVKWMFINGGLGALGTYAQVGGLLSLFGKDIADYPLAAHIIPFLYYTMYTFLLRRAVLDFSGALGDPATMEKVDRLYVAGHITLSLLCLLASRG